MDTMVNREIITTVTDPDLFTSLGLVIILTLLVLLVLKEVSTAAGWESSIIFRRVLNVASLPMLLAAVLIIAMQITRYA